ncbi:hypothetical protein [Streptomyces sp. MT206]|uniref:hypothetical protein n=1 Tax=Streptomyces sp. MT206 TaxID=3031407 RepID=UPI002FC7F7FE
MAFAKIVQQPALHWSSNDRASQAASDGNFPLELHVLPLDFPGYSARELDQLGASLMERIRDTRMIGSDVALNPIRSDGYVGASIPASRPGSWNAPQEGEAAECRLYKAGQLSMRATLPRDSCGAILDPDAPPQQLAGLLRFAGTLNVVQADRIVVAAGVLTETLMSVDTFDPRRSRQSYQPIGPGRSGRQLRTEPDESVTLAALGAGAAEVAPHLAQVLILQARR